MGQSLQNRETAKRLQSQLSKAEGEAQALRLELSRVQSDYSKKQNDVARLKKEIEKLSAGKGLTVSEHAILRYQERVNGLDLEQAKSAILSPSVLALIEKLGGSGEYPNKEGGFVVVLKDGVVVTVK